MVEKAFDDGRIRVATLNPAQPKSFDLRPGSAELEDLSEALGLVALRKVRLAGDIAAEGQRGWTLNALLGATVVQPCVVTLAPVTTRIDTPVARRYLPADQVMPEDMPAEAEMPEDDSLEPLGDVIDLTQVLTEALTLALPQYPRADGAELGAATFAEKGVAPLGDQDVKPFAGLRALRDKLHDDN